MAIEKTVLPELAIGSSLIVESSLIEDIVDKDLVVLSSKIFDLTGWTVRAAKYDGNVLVELNDVNVTIDDAPGGKLKIHALPASVDQAVHSSLSKLLEIRVIITNAAGDLSHTALVLVVTRS